MVRFPTRTARSGSAASPTPLTPSRLTPSPPTHEALESRVLFASVAPTTEEQLMIELINRARANPPQYASDFFLSVPLTDAEPMPPLAVNGFLTGSARGHALEMAGNDYFAHTSPITGKGPNQMARDAGYPLGAQFSTALTANNVESIAAGPGMAGPGGPPRGRHSSCCSRTPAAPPRATASTCWG